MKVQSLLGLGMLFLVACTKSNATLDSTTPAGASTTNSESILVNPTNCPPSLFQSNANAFHYNFSKMQLSAGMTGMLSSTSPSVSAVSVFHVYLKTADGKYCHLPSYSPGNIPYSYSVKASFPYSTLTITRPNGNSETFESIIVIGVNGSYLSGLTKPINFDDYGTAKTKLGF